MPVAAGFGGLRRWKIRDAELPARSIGANSADDRPPTGASLRPSLGRAACRWRNSDVELPENSTGAYQHGHPATVCRGEAVGGRCRRRQRPPMEESGCSIAKIIHRHPRSQASPGVGRDRKLAGGERAAAADGRFGTLSCRKPPPAKSLVRHQSRICLTSGATVGPVVTKVGLRIAAEMRARVDDGHRPAGTILPTGLEPAGEFEVSRPSREARRRRGTMVVGSASSAGNSAETCEEVLDLLEAAALAAADPVAFDEARAAVAGMHS